MTTLADCLKKYPKERFTVKVHCNLGHPDHYHVTVERKFLYLLILGIFGRLGTNRFLKRLGSLISKEMGGKLMYPVERYEGSLHFTLNERPIQGLAEIYPQYMLERTETYTEWHSSSRRVATHETVNTYWTFSP